MLSSATGGCPTQCPFSSDSDKCKRNCLRTCFDDELADLVAACCDCDRIKIDDAKLCALPTYKIVFACVILVICLLLLAKRRWAVLPVGRSIGAGLCAVLTVVLTVLTPEFALNQPGVVDVNTIATLLGLTIITGVARETGVLALLVRALQHKCAGPRWLLVRTVAVTAATAALLTNDAAVLVLTDPILGMAASFGVAAEPFAIALATSARHLTRAFSFRASLRLCFFLRISSPSSRPTLAAR